MQFERKLKGSETSFVQKESELSRLWDKETFFLSFQVSVMLGSHVFKYLSKMDSVESFMRYFCSENFLTDINVMWVNFKGSGILPELRYVPIIAVQKLNWYDLYRSRLHRRPCLNDFCHIGLYIFPKKFSLMFTPSWYGSTDNFSWLPDRQVDNRYSGNKWLACRVCYGS